MVVLAGFWRSAGSADTSDSVSKKHCAPLFGSATTVARNGKRDNCAVNGCGAGAGGDGDDGNGGNDDDGCDAYAEDAEGSRDADNDGGNHVDGVGYAGAPGCRQVRACTPHEGRGPCCQRKKTKHAPKTAAVPAVTRRCGIAR